MSNYSVQGFMDNLPAPILDDPHLRQLAEVAARVMLKVYSQRDIPNIYPRIDQLAEGVLDILAKDLKVDWYDYNASLSEKRRTIKDNWYVHKRMGTKRAVERALSDVWPNSQVEEWFDYSGDPYHFRVILDTSESEAPVDIGTVMKKVKLFKPARAVMDGGEPIVKVTCGIVIETGNFTKTYHVGRCGTKPRRKSHGGKENEGLVLGVSSLTHSYHVKYCGTPLGALM